MTLPAVHVPLTCGRMGLDHNIWGTSIVCETEKEREIVRIRGNYKLTLKITGALAPIVPFL